MPTRSIFSFVVAMILGAESSAVELTPGEIFEKAKAAYRSMETYQAKGAITTHTETNGVKFDSETAFSILLKKPNLYVISWVDQISPVSGTTQGGAVWSDGTQPYLYIGIANAYSKMEGDDMALAGATGISQGAAHTIPSFFLSESPIKADVFFRLDNPQIEEPERIGDDDCFVISGSSPVSKKATFWISKKSFLVRKYSHSLEFPKGGPAVPEMTDERIERIIKAGGGEVTEERIAKMRETLKNARSQAKTMKGFTTEVHMEISSPELTKADFQYTLPEGVVLKDSLFD